MNTIGFYHFFRLSSLIPVFLVYELLGENAFFASTSSVTGDDLVVPLLPETL